MTVVMNKKGCGVSSVAFYLVIVGAINWGLIGLGYFFSSNWNLVGLIFGKVPVVEAIVYVVVGICAVVMLVGCPCSTCKLCKAEEATPKI